MVFDTTIVLFVVKVLAQVVMGLISGLFLLVQYLF